MIVLFDMLKACREYPFRHHGWSHAPSGDYGIFAEDGATAIWGDDRIQGQAVEGTVDLFTRDDSLKPRETVQRILDSSGASWSLNSIQFEQETGYIHYEWLWNAFDAAEVPEDG